MKNAKIPTEKPTQEAKALSLFLMAFKAKSPAYKEELKRINKLWDLAKDREISKADYQKHVVKMLDSYGGYSIVVEKTVRFYLEKTGQWSLKSDDPYGKDAKAIADKILKK